MLDANGEECIIVVKNGATTGVTLGRATGIESFVREYKDYAIHSTSMYIAVYPHSNKDGTFSSPGTPGLLSVTPTIASLACLLAVPVRLIRPMLRMCRYTYLHQCIKKAFPHSYLFPVQNPIQA